MMQKEAVLIPADYVPTCGMCNKPMTLVSRADSEEHWECWVEDCEAGRCTVYGERANV